MRLLCIFILFFAVVTFSACNAKQTEELIDVTEMNTQSSTSDSADQMINNSLLSMAPPFVSESYTMVLDSNTSAIIEFDDVTEDEFTAYKIECENFGFVFDGFITDEYYIASNADGYVVTVAFTNNKMMVEVDAPEQS